MVVQKLNALVIDPDHEARMRLKQITHTAYEYDQVDLCRNIEEALGLLQRSNKGYYDVAFLSHRLDNEETTDLINMAKDTPGGQDSAYILVLSSSEQDISTVASSVLKGADGVLFEPFSVDFLEAITKLAAEVKLQRREDRQKKVIDALLNQAILLVDKIADAKFYGEEPGETARQLRKIGEKICEFNDTVKELYYIAALEKFEKARPAYRPEGVEQKQKLSAKKRLAARLKQRGIN